MTVEDSGNQNSERIWRLLQARSHAHATSINEAQARLHELVQAAKDGRPQLIGLDDHVVLLSISTLSEVFLSLQKPENWGEYFATRASLPNTIPNLPCWKAIKPIPIITTS